MLGVGFALYSHVERKGYGWHDTHMLKVRVRVEFILTCKSRVVIILTG
jgi:hypothetical protein